jgi:outer membrane protein assembly factor BamB
VVLGDLLLLNRDDPNEAYLLAVDKRTGKTAWKTEYGNPSKSPGSGNTATPVLWKDEIIVHRSTEILGLDAKTGARKWNVAVRSTGVGTPVVSDDAVFVSTWNNTGEPDLRSHQTTWDDLLKGDKNADGMISPDEYPATVEMARRPESSVPGTTLALPAGRILGQADSNKDGLISKEEFEAFRGQVAANTQEHGLIAIRGGASGDVTKTHVMWRESKSVSEVPSPLFSNGRVYMVTNGGVVTCLEAGTGKVLFRGRLGAGGSYFSSPVAADGKVYFSSGDGVIVVIKDADKLEVLAKDDLGEPIFATPAIVGGTLYTRTTTHMYAFGAAK